MSFLLQLWDGGKKKIKKLCKSLSVPHNCASWYNATANDDDNECMFARWYILMPVDSFLFIAALFIIIIIDSVCTHLCQTVLLNSSPLLWENKKGKKMRHFTFFLLLCSCLMDVVQCLFIQSDNKKHCYDFIWPTMRNLSHWLHCSDVSRRFIYGLLCFFDLWNDIITTWNPSKMLHSR